jgi:hypothetical protein
MSSVKLVDTEKDEQYYIVLKYRDKRFKNLKNLYELS